MKGGTRQTIGNVRHLAFLGLLLLLVLSIQANAYCETSYISTRLGDLVLAQNEMKLIPFSNSGELMPSLNFGIRFLGLAEVKRMVKGFCHYDPGFSKWDDNFQRFSLLTDLNCTSKIEMIEMPNGANLMAYKYTYVTDLYPDLVINLTASVIDREYIKPIVPGYSATYSPSKVKFDADIINWPWMNDTSNVAMFAQVLFPSGSDFVVTASANRSMRSIEYKNSEGVTLALSTETDFLVDGVHYQTASDEKYGNFSQMTAVPFAVGFCNGTGDLHRWTKLSYDPTLSYLFPSSEPPTTVNPQIAAKKHVPAYVAGIIFGVVAVVVIVGCILIYMRHRSRYSQASKRLDNSFSSGKKSKKETETSSLNCEDTISEDNTTVWAPASKPLS